MLYTDLNRRNIDFKEPKVVEVLPEYFREEYPQLIAMLEAYMQFMDSDGGINDDLRNLYKTRDIDSISLEFLAFLLAETGGGISPNVFQDPREIAKGLPDFFRFKGSIYSTKGFFRALYGEEVDVEYPKENVFIVGESKIGPESLKFIQNGKLYQTLSILIKSSRSLSQWRDLYKKYVHPSGFYLGAEVLIEPVVDMSLDSMPCTVFYEEENSLIVEAEAFVSLSTNEEPITTFLVDSTGTEYRQNLNKNMAAYDSATITDVDGQYESIISLSDANSKLFSDSADSNGIDWSNTIETFDQSTYDSL